MFGRQEHVGARGVDHCALHLRLHLHVVEDRKVQLPGQESALQHVLGPLDEVDRKAGMDLVELLEQWRQRRGRQGDVAAEGQHTAQRVSTGGDVGEVLSVTEKVACMAQHLGACGCQRHAVCLATYGELNLERTFEVRERLRQS